jgi:cytochrome c biogenesis protein ResB
MARDYKSDLVVLEEGQAVASKTIEVNDPLRYKEYHIYQSGYDPEGGRFSILQVKSNSGLWMVYAGFILMVGGSFWWCWGKPTLRYVRRNGHGN